MQKIAFVLACLACVGHGQQASEQESLPETSPSEALATLLLANNPESAFNSAIARPLTRASPRSQGPIMAASRSLPWMESPVHLEGMIGNAGFDPLGLSTPENVKWMREAELKHGRMCQLAWLGYVTVDLGIKFPGEKYAPLNSFSAHDATADYELFLVLLWVGTFEFIGMKQIYNMVLGYDEERQPGDFGFDPLFLLTPETEERYKTAELVHGRLAMLAFSAVVTQSAIGYPNFPYC